jgi:AGZA family xanthine/uracil permease-like MFS transporter
MEALHSFFKLEENNTTVLREFSAGLTTFATMSYIIFVQPAVLSAAGMDFGSVMVATCLASAVATVMMGLLANYPIGLAPAMGHNFFFVYTVVLALGVPWEAALGAVFISGFLFIVLSFFGLRERLINSVPEPLKHGIAIGIGLLIALVGLEWAGIVVSAPGTFIGLGNLKSPPVLVSLFGLMIICILMALKVRAAILWGIGAAIVVGIPAGIVQFKGVASLPPSLSPTLFKLDIPGALGLGLLSIIFVFFFLDLFDTVGTLIGIGEEGKFIKDGTLPRAREAFLADAVGTVTGALLGTSTVTSYIESAAGVGAGGRTGLANIVTAALFIGALFFSPIVKMIGGGYQVGEGHILYPVIAPALIVVGSLMFKGATRIKWDDPTEYIPAFLTLITMPVTFSITEGISFGFISYSLLKLITGRGKEAPVLIHVFSFLFVVRYLFLV